MGGGAFGLPLSDIETTGSTTFSAAAGFQVVVRSWRAAAEAIEKCSRRQRPTSRVNGQGFGDEASKIHGRSGESMVQVLQVPSKLTSGAQRSAAYAACTRERGDFSCARLCPGVAPDTNGTGMICFQIVMAVPNLQFSIIVLPLFS